MSITITIRKILYKIRDIQTMLSLDLPIFFSHIFRMSNDEVTK